MYKHSNGRVRAIIRSANPRRTNITRGSSARGEDLFRRCRGARRERGGSLTRERWRADGSERASGGVRLPTISPSGSGGDGGREISTRPPPHPLRRPLPPAAD